MTVLSRPLRFLPLFGLLALVLALAAGPRHAAPSVMEVRLAQAMMAGAGPQDLCGMGPGTAAPDCVFCLPPLAMMPADLPGPVLRPEGPPAVSGGLAAAPGLQMLRAHGPGRIRGPPAGDLRLV